jgi:hypothetical protein
MRQPTYYPRYHERQELGEQIGNSQKQCGESEISKDCEELSASLFETNMFP